MKRNEYFDEMRETSSVVIPRLRQVIDDLTRSDPHLLQAMNIIVNRRTRDEQQLLRPYLLRLAFEIASGDWTEEAIDACVAVELFNISTYQSNIAFDRKINILDTVDKDSQFICSMMTLGAAERLLNECATKISQRASNGLLPLLRQTNDDIYRGQFQDLHILNSTVFENGETPEGYYRAYEERCRLLGGRLMSFCLQAGAMLGGAGKGLLCNLDVLGEEIGTAGQMVNDLADLLPRRLVDSDLNGYKPSYSDLRNDKVTYAVFDLWFNAKEHAGYVEALLKRGDVTDDEGERLFELLCKTGSVFRTRGFIARRYSKLKKRVKQIPSCRARKMLEIALSSLVTNKYFAVIRHDKSLDYGAAL